MESKICPFVNSPCIGSKCLSFTEKPIIKYIHSSSRIPSKPIHDGSYFFCTVLQLNLSNIYPDFR